MALTQVPIELSSTPGIVDNSNATAITIDSSENILVGKTSLAIANEGIVFEKGGAAEFTTDSARVMRLNRTSDSGSVLEINEDGATVGVIGTGSGSLFIGNTSQSSGISFFGTALYPNSGGSISATNGANDLGAATARWKDLYLSGGAYLGGTAAANHLDDYEEGTWTPAGYSGWATNPTSVSATYTKIGRLVMLNMLFAGGSFNNQCYLTGIPFAESFEGTAPVVNGSITVSATAMIASTNRLWFSATNGQTSDGSRLSIVYETSE